MDRYADRHHRLAMTRGDEEQLIRICHREERSDDAIHQGVAQNNDPMDRHADRLHRLAMTTERSDLSRRSQTVEVLLLRRSRWHVIRMGR